MNNQIRQAKLNWIIPAKGVNSEGIEQREVLVTKNYVLNKQTGNKTFFRNHVTGEAEEVQFDDFCVKMDKNLDELGENFHNIFLSKFKTGNININLYGNYNSGEFLPYITVTTQSKRGEYFLLISNNNRKYDELYEKKGRFVGYLGYNLYGCKLITIGRLSPGSTVPLYIKNGEVTFTNDNNQTQQKTVYDVKNLMLYNKDRSEKVLYKRLFTCETLDYKIDVKYMRINIPTSISFDIYGKFVDRDGYLRIDALKDLKNSEFDPSIISNGAYITSKYVYQFNVLYVNKNTGKNNGIGYSYFPILI